MAKPVRFEDQEQKALIQWAETQKHPFLPGQIGDYLFHIPNGSSSLPIKLAMKLKYMGLRAGVPDLMFATTLPTKGAGGLFIEMKKQRQHFRCKSEADKACSDNQVEYQERMKVAGYIVVVCYGWEEAVHAIEEYLSHGG